MRRYILVFLAAAACAVPSALRAASWDIDITAPDGAKLKATIYDPGKPGPGVILLHQCNSDRKSWDELATKLMENGIHVMTLDQRGYGESAGATAPEGERRVMRLKWPADDEAAFEWFFSRKVVDGNHMGAAGASCGVNQAVLLASKNPGIRALVLLSGPANDEGKDFIKGAPTVAILGAASEKDRGAAEAVRQLVRLSPNPDSKDVIIDGRAHGVPMFSEDKDLLPAVVDWFTSHLSASSPSAP